MSDLFDSEVLICGAGAAALTLGIDLARLGVPFHLIDKLSGPFGGSRGKGIQPRSLEVYENLGSVDQICARGGSYPLERKYGPGGAYKDAPTAVFTPPTGQGCYPNAPMLPRFPTEQALRNRQAKFGGQVAFGVELLKFRQTRDAVIVKSRGRNRRRSRRVRHLVGADGGRSFVRQALKFDFPGETLGVRAIVADVKATGVCRDAWHRWNGGAPNQISLCPLVGTDMFQRQGSVTLQGDVDPSRVDPPRFGLQMHEIGEGPYLVDPDGAITTAGEPAALEPYLQAVGLCVRQP